MKPKYLGCTGEWITDDRGETKKQKQKSSGICFFLKAKPNGTLRVFILFVCRNNLLSASSFITMHKVRQAGHTESLSQLSASFGPAAAHLPRSQALSSSTGLELHKLLLAEKGQSEALDCGARSEGSCRRGPELWTKTKAIWPLGLTGPLRKLASQLPITSLSFQHKPCDSDQSNVLPHTLRISLASSQSLALPHASASAAEPHFLLSANQAATNDKYQIKTLKAPWILIECHCQGSDMLGQAALGPASQGGGFPPAPLIPFRHRFPHSLQEHVLLCSSTKASSPRCAPPDCFWEATLENTNSLDILPQAVRGRQMCGGPQGNPPTLLGVQGCPEGGGGELRKRLLEETEDWDLCVTNNRAGSAQNQAGPGPSHCFSPSVQCRY